MNNGNIELHAHLSGCMRQETLKELLIQQFGENETYNFDKCETLEQCFILFGKINQLKLNIELVRRITSEIFEDFKNDGVTYLEIRATPKNGLDFDKLIYLQTISEEINKAQIEVKLIVGIDRAKGIDDAQQTYQIIKNNKIQHLVGVDLSGHPGKGTFKEFIPILENIRKLGYKITIHTGELPNQINENDEILQFKPDRIGHFIYFNQEQLELVKQQQIPIEVCFSSNLFTTKMNPIDHPIKQFLINNIPISICTDDTLCFATTIQQEIKLIQQTFDLKDEIIQDIIKKSHKQKFRIE